MTGRLDLRHSKRPNWHVPTRTWTPISPYDNPYVVRWSETPALRRLLWRLGIKR